MGSPRIQQRFLFALVGVVTAVLLPAVLMLERGVGDSVRELIRDSMVEEARLLSQELERQRPADLSSWVAHLSPLARVTVIDDKGVVRADSEVAAELVSKLENHRDRPEVRAALTGGVGVSERRSTTVHRTLLYVAVPIGGAAPGVLRLARTLDQVQSTVRRGQFDVWLAALMAMALALLLGTLLSRWLTRPLIAMTRAARAMSHGDFALALPTPRDDELGDLVHSLETLRSQLAGRMAELRQEGQKLRAIIHGMSEGVALIQDGIVTVANLAFAQLLGLPAVTTVEEHGFRDVVRLPALGDAIESAAAKGFSTVELQRGERVLVAKVEPLSATPVSQVVVVLIDMTESKRLERLRREFVANASHELRTPVAAILAASETLAGGAAEDPVARGTFLEILLRHAQRLSRLTADLLDIARLEGGYRPRIEAVAVQKAIDGVVSALESKATAKEITLVREVVPPGLQLSAEPAAVEQILTNLVDNAIKYTLAGGRVRVRGEAARGDSVALIVEDTGPGIPNHHLGRLFERFYRVDDARSRELGGTGLGLAIVKHLVLANRGDVAVESQLGVGTRFTVSLPRHRGSAS